MYDSRIVIIPPIIIINIDNCVFPIGTSNSDIIVSITSENSGKYFIISSITKSSTYDSGFCKSKFINGC